MKLSHSLALLAMLVGRSGTVVEAFLQPTIPELQPIKDAMDRLGRQPNIGPSATVPVSPPADIDNDKPLKDFVKRSSAWAAETATGFAQGVMWLATDKDSPALPLAAATHQFIEERMEEASSHWNSHGDEYKKVLLDTTETVHRDVAMWGKAAWEIFSQEAFLPLQDAKRLLGTLQHHQKPLKTEEIKHFYFLSNDELEHVPVSGVDEKENSQFIAIKDGIHTKAQKVFSFFMEHGTKSKKVLRVSEVAESVRKKVIRWGEEMARKKGSDPLPTGLPEGVVSVKNQKHLGDDILNIVQEASALEALVNDQIQHSTSTQKNPRMHTGESTTLLSESSLAAEDKQTKFPAFAVTYMQEDKKSACTLVGKTRNDPEVVQRALLSDRLQYDAKYRVRLTDQKEEANPGIMVPTTGQYRNLEIVQKALLSNRLQDEAKQRVRLTDQKEVANVDSFGSVGSPFENSEALQRALLCSRLQNENSERMSLTSQKEKICADTAVPTIRQYQHSEALHRALLCNRLRYEVRKRTRRTDQKVKKSNPEVFQRALLSTRLHYESKKNVRPTEQKEEADSFGKVQVSSQPNQLYRGFQRELMATMLRCERFERDRATENKLEGATDVTMPEISQRALSNTRSGSESNVHTGPVEMMRQHRNPEVFLRALLCTQSQRQVSKSGACPTNMNPAMVSYKTVFKSRQKNDPDLLQRADFNTGSCLQSDENTANVESRKKVQMSRQQNYPEAFQRALLRARFDIESRERTTTMDGKTATELQRNSEVAQRTLLQNRLLIEARERVGSSQNQNRGADLNVSGKSTGHTDIEMDQEQASTSRGSLEDLVNASLGLTAPTDLLRENELKSREEKVAREYPSKEECKKEEQEKVRELMNHISRAGVAKKQNIATARKDGLLAASARTVAAKKPIAFERSRDTPSEAALSPAIATIIGRNTTRVDQLNHYIRVKYEETKDKMHRNELERATFVVEKLERRGPGKLQRVAMNLIQWTVLSLVRFYVTRLRGTILNHHASLFSSAEHTVRNGPASNVQT